MYIITGTLSLGMDGKMKISFGIKSSKQGSIQKKAPVVSNDVEFISSFDKTCKPLGSEKPKEELVIPSQANKIGKDVLEEILKSKQSSQENSNSNNGSLANSLESMAVKELIDASKGAPDKESSRAFEVPLPSEYMDANEATIDDYERIPIEEYGKAMLRGMGWAPGKGIGKNERVVAPSVPQLRPKGMGLGADKLSVSNQPQSSSLRSSKEDVSLVTGCGVQVIAGSYKGLYGKVVSHNEDNGRCIIKLEIGGSSVSVNENLLKPVTKEEYSSNCRVLNAAKYNKYKESSDAKLNEMRRHTDNSYMVDDDRKQRSISPEPRKSSSSSSRRRHRSRSPLT